MSERWVTSDASAISGLRTMGVEALALVGPSLGWKSTRQLFVIPASLALFLLLAKPVTAASQTAADVGPLRGEFERRTPGMLAYELLPSFNGNFKGVQFHTNRWGMRDKDYDLKPPPRTYRIAILGSSLTMGAGVPGELTFEALLENRLNREGPGAPRRHYEILNFAVVGYGILQNVVVADRKIFPFAPSAVLVEIHSAQRDRLISHLARLVTEGAQIEYPYVRQKLQEAGVQPGMLPPEMHRRLARVAPDLLQWSFKRLAEICREHHVPVVAILFPEPREGRRAERFATLAAAAAEAGMPVLDLEGVYNGHRLDSLRLGDVDPHLNVLGHQVVADRLFQLLRENDALTLKLGFPAAR